MIVDLEYSLDVHVLFIIPQTTIISISVSKQWLISLPNHLLLGWTLATSPDLTEVWNWAGLITWPWRFLEITLTPCQYMYIHVQCTDMK